MTNKPTYEKLEKQVKELHNEAFVLREEKKTIQEQLNLSKIILSATPDLLVLKDRDFVYQAVNPAFCKFLGKTEGSIIGKTDFDLFPRFEAEMYRRDDLKVIKTGKPQLQDEEVTGEDEKRWLRVAKTPVLSEKGASIGVLCSVVDITNRKRAEESLARAEHEKETILDSLLEIVVYMDLEMRILWANISACKSVDLTRDELIGRHCFELWADSSEPCSDCAVVRAIKTGQAQEIEKTTPDGRSWFNIGCPVRDEKNTIIGGIEVTLEITERKQTEEALRESEERYRTLAENSLVGFWRITLEGYTTYINPAMCSMIEIEGPEALSGQTYHSFFTRKSLETIDRERVRQLQDKSSSYEVEIVGKSGGRRNVVKCGASLLSAEGKIQGYVATFTDITDRKRVEKALQKAHDELERRVEKRTRELEIKTSNLEEVNTALKVLLKQRENDRTELEEKVLFNIKELVTPFLNKLKKTNLDAGQMDYVNVLESNLNDIISPFVRRFSLNHLKLTPSEIQIANLVKQGMTSKQIAKMFNLSGRTIETHRKNIRDKLGLKSKKANLRTYLLSTE